MTFLSIYIVVLNIIYRCEHKLRMCRIQIFEYILYNIPGMLNLMLMVYISGCRVYDNEYKNIFFDLR